MILERFNAITFIGDELAQSTYAAFNVLLREGFSLLGVQQWIMSDQDRMNCKCDGQFLNPECTGYAVKNRDEVKKNGDDQKRRPYTCARKSLFPTHHNIAHVFPEFSVATYELRAYQHPQTHRHLSKTSPT